MAKRRPRDAKGLKRAAPKRKPYERVLIVCEGVKTEPHYFEELREYYRLSNANIAVTSADGSDPISVVRTAKRRQQDETKQGELYDRVYCVFDRDEHTNFNEACHQLEVAGFQSSRSWPCFEFWVLLHFRYTRHPFTRDGTCTGAERCIQALKREMHTYQKGTKGIFAELLPKLNDAKRRAEQALIDARATGEDNPSTEVHELVDYLQHLKVLE